MSSVRNKIEILLFLKSFLEGKCLSLLSNYKDIKDLQDFFEKSENNNFTEFCYNNLITTYDILYQEEESINIITKEKNYQLSFYFYLILLIEYDKSKNIVHYEYTFDLINQNNDENKKEQNKFKKLIFSKIILELINNFRGINQTENDDIINNLNNIEKDITNNLPLLSKEIGLDKKIENIKEKSIELIYIEIIEILIINNKIEDFQYTYDIINQLDLEHIEITNKMLNKISEILNSNYINKYKITKIEELFNIRNINFYYILLKYILKKPIFIYQIPLLLNTRIIIITAIKQQSIKLFSSELNDNDIKERMEYILEQIMDSDYYYNKYNECWNTIEEKLNHLLNYYQNYNFESKKKEINSIKEIIQNKSGNIEEFLNNKEMQIDEANKKNDRFELIHLIYELKYKNEKKESNFQECLKTWENLESYIKDKKIKRLRVDLKNILYNYFKEEKNKDKLLKIFDQDQYDYFLTHCFNNINDSKENLDNSINEKEKPILSEIEKKNEEDSKISEDELKLIEYIYNNPNNKIRKKFSEEEKKKNWKEIKMLIQNKTINKINKDYKENLFNFIKENNKETLLNIFTEENFHFLKEKANQHYKKDKLNEILKYYKYYFPESKEKDINLIEEMIKKEEFGENCELYLKYYDEALKNNIKAPIINLFLEKSNEELSIKSKEKKINDALKIWGNLEKMINDKKFKKLRKSQKKILINYFENKDNTERLLKIFSKDIYDNFIKEIKSLDSTDLIPENKEVKKDKNNKNNSNKLEINPDNSSNADISLINKSTKIKTKQTEQSKKISYTNKDAHKEKNISENEIIIKKMLKKMQILLLYMNKEDKEGKNIEYDEIKYGKKLIKISKDKFQEIKNNFEKDNIQEDLVSHFNKFCKFLEEIENRITNEFKRKYNLKIRLEFEGDDSYNISCIYSFYPEDQEIVSFKEDDIFVNKANSYAQGFEYLISEINEEKYANIKLPINEESTRNDSSIKDRTGFDQNNLKDITGIDKSNLNITDEFQFQDYENKTNKIIEIPKIIGSHKDKDAKSFYTAEFIKELSNGYYISGGTDNKLIVYNNEFEIVLEIDEIKEWTFSIFERTDFEGKNENKVQLITCSNKEVYLIDIDFTELSDSKGSKNSKESFKTQKYELPNMTCVACVEMKNSNYALIGLNNAVYFIDLFNKGHKQIKHITIIDKTYRGLIKIKDNIIALTSNKVAVGGEDRLIFFNSEKTRGNKISSEINDFSFTLTTNGLALMQRTTKDNKKPYQILLCACKKYLKDQQNGILLANPQLEDNKTVEKPFFSTEEFEVYCFCPIKDTDLFFVGGFDNEINEGKIKLYKVLYDEKEDKAWKTKIEFKQDIIFDKGENDKNFEGFEGPISCIIQSSSGEILATCYDGNVYKFSYPNLDFYKLEKK